MQTILEEIASVLGETPPTKFADINAFAKQAVNLHRKRWNELSFEARTYLSEMVLASRSNQTIQAPGDFIEKSKSKTATAVIDPEAKDAPKFEDEEPVDDTEPVPEGFVCSYNPQVYTVDNIVRLFEAKRLKSPDFQRQFVWTREFRQAFLRSVFIGIPIPSIMLAADEEQSQDRFILDGLQRLTTLVMFKNNKETLGKGLRGYTNKTYLQLSSDDQSKFDFAKLAVLEVQTARENWSYIFRMINRNGMQLNAMELRRAIFPLEIIMELDDFATHHLNWTTMHGKNTRHKGLASILQAVACHYNWENYRKSMDQFMDVFCKMVRKKEVVIDSKLLKKNLHFLTNAMHTSLGRGAFRLDIRRAANHGLLNSMIHAGLVMIEQKPDITEKELIANLKDIKAKILDNDMLMLTLRRDTTGKDNVILRMSQVTQLAEKAVKKK